jgi:hypothetical protein
METESSSPPDEQLSAPNALSDPPNEPSPPADEPAKKNQDLTTLVTSDKVRDIIDKILSFLSSASNETLGACAVGLCATTYLVLGRVGLVLIGVAGGIVLHATWEASNHTGAGGQGNAADSSRRRRELGIEVVRRTLEWRATSKDAPDGEALKSSTVDSLSDDKMLGYTDFRPATRSALTALTDAVIRDYVRYSPKASAYIQANIWLDGGIHQSYRPKTNFPRPVVRPLSASSVASLLISVAREPPILFSISWPTGLRSLLSFLTSSVRHCKLLNVRVLKKQSRPIYNTNQKVTSRTY